MTPEKITHDKSSSTAGVLPEHPSIEDKLAKLRSDPVKPHQSYRGNKLVVVLSLALVGVISAVAVDYVTEGKPAIPDTEAKYVVPNKPKADDMGTASKIIAEPGLQAQGYVLAARTATVSARVTGIISSIEVKSGDLVRKGDVIARLRSDQAEIDLRLAQARVRANRARSARIRTAVFQAQLELERSQDLFAQGIRTEAELQSDENELNMIQKELEASDAELAFAELQVERQKNTLDDHIVRAPFDGVVLALNAQIGELLAPSAAGGGFTRTGLCTLVDTNSLEVIVELNEKMIARISKGKKVAILPYANKSLRVAGVVEQLMPEIDRTKGTQKIRVSFLERENEFLPGMAVQVQFLQGDEDDRVSF